MGDLLQQLTGQGGFLLFIKILLLIVIGMVFLYAFILVTQVQSLKKTVFIESAHGSSIISLLVTIYAISVLVLFLVTLAIL